MAKKNYLKKLTVSDGKGGTEDIVVLTPEALTDVVRVTKSRIESIDDAVAALNDKVVEAVSGDVIYTAQPDSAEQLAEDGTVFYLDCADLGGKTNVNDLAKQTGMANISSLVGDWTAAKARQAGYIGCTTADCFRYGLIGPANTSEGSPFILAGDDLSLSEVVLVMFGARLRPIPNGENGYVLFEFQTTTSSGSLCLVYSYDSKFLLKIPYKANAEFHNTGYITLPITPITDGEIHQYAFEFYSATEADDNFNISYGHFDFKYWVDGVESSLSSIYTAPESIIDSSPPYAEMFACWVTEDDGSGVAETETPDLVGLSYLKMCRVPFGEESYWGDGTCGNVDGTKVIAYQYAKAAVDYTAYLTTTEALKKLIKSLNYDLEVGGSLDVTLGGLAWVNGETLLSQANTAGTTLSNVTLRNVTIENSDIADSTISESEITGAEMSESLLDGTNEIYHVIGSPEKVKEWLEESDLTWDDEEKTEENVSVATASTEVLSKELKRLDKTKLGGELVDNGDGSSTLIFDAGTYGSSANNNIIDGGEIQSDGSVIDAGGF